MVGCDENTNDLDEQKVNNEMTRHNDLGINSPSPPPPADGPLLSRHQRDWLVETYLRLLRASFVVYCEKRFTATLIS